jgi:GAF domain-containing protein
VNPDLLTSILDLVNETLAAAIVIVAVSLLLYTLTRNFQDRVARASVMVLFSVTATYVCDVLISLRPTEDMTLALLRAQWIGVALAPAALVHLSDALLETTGLPSRGRRRRILRVMYLIAAAFILLANFGDQLVAPISSGGRAALRAMPLMGVFIAFTIVACGFAFINVDRARRRCLTRATRRRMLYLEIALLTPILGVFPFSVFFNPGGEFTTGALVVLIATNVFVVLMLLFIAYPLSFFGSRFPDRVVKADLLRMVLRGPATGMLIVATLFFTGRVNRILDISGEEFSVFAVVGVVLFWQWMIDLALPQLDRWLIYGDDEDDQFTKIQQLNRQLLTETDLLMLLEGILAQARNQLQTGGAFVASINEGQPEVVRATGTGHEIEAKPENLVPILGALQVATVSQPLTWEQFWLIPLTRQRGVNGGQLIGVLGVQATNTAGTPSPEEISMLAHARRRAARTLDDLMLQEEVVAALEGLLPQFASSRTTIAEIEYQTGRTSAERSSDFSTLNLPDRDQIVEQVAAAMRHYYGGPGLTKSRLLELTVVRKALEENDNEPTRALRAVLDKAIELQRPPGERDYRSQDWLIYNVIELRYIKKQRVREVANRLYMSDANLYRKQNLAIESVADTILRLEAEMLSQENPEIDSKSVL